MNKSRFYQLVQRVFGIVFLLSLLSCASLYKNYDKKLLKTDEFDERVKIQPTPVPQVEAKPLVEKGTGASQKREKTKTQDGGGKKQTTKPDEKVSPEKKPEKITEEKQAPEKKKLLKKHLPALEDSDGFDGRRPVVDPLRVGEKAIYSISYFAVEAGRLSLEVRPFVKVNGKKSWHFFYRGKSSSVFSLFYAVDDTAESFLDYEQLIPYSYSIHVKESKQVKEVRSYFDWKKYEGYTWDKTLKKGKKLKKEEHKWKIRPYSQNVFTAIFYLRHFSLDVGKDLAIYVGHEGKNLIMRAKVVRKEVLRTAIGKRKAIVVKPEFEVDGMFKKVGDISVWLSDDDRKHVLRIESKIKIGTIVAAIEELKP